MIKDMTEAILSVSKILTYHSAASTEAIDARGNPIRSTPTSTTFRGSLQPMTTKDLIHMPVGFEIERKWKLFVPISEKILTHQDIVGYNGRRMIVTQLEDWSDEGAYIKYILEEVNIGTR
jgi:hypothetical protein